MKLDRTTQANGPGVCKYALVKLRPIKNLPPKDLATAQLAIRSLESLGLLDYAAEGESECFVIRLKDKAAAVALAAYSWVMAEHDKEFAAEILKLSEKAHNHPNKAWPT